MPKINLPNLKGYKVDKLLDNNYVLTITLVLKRSPTDKELSALKEKSRMNAGYVRVVNDLFIKIIGTSKTFDNIFKVKLYQYKKGNKVFFSNDSEIILGIEYDYIDDIIGFNNFEFFKHHMQIKLPKLNSTRATSFQGINTRGLNYFTPTQLASIYNFPTAYNGANQTVAIIELGGGYKQADLDVYFNYLGVNPKPQVIPISVDGATNSPDYSSASQEVALNIEILGTIANASTILVYFAPNSFQGFYDAFYAAIMDTRNPNIIAVSWGAAEVIWGSSYLNIFNSLYAYAVQKGINIIAASGDYGSSDGLNGLNVDSPASSPNVVACGGTSLDSNGISVQNEVVWPGSGGGYSSVFAKPIYQNNNQLVTNFRCVPDISVCANPYTGYLIYMDGYWYIVGGTSCGVPLVAGLLARVNQYKGGNGCGFINTKLYLNKPVALITSGSNGAYSAFSDGRYNLCTGLGRLNGTNILTSI
jgi:kumamolisin